MPDRSLPVCVACGIPAQHGPVYEFVVHELGDDPRIPEGLYHEDCIPIPKPRRRDGSAPVTVEVCGSCGQPANPADSYWFAPNDLWNEVNGSPNGFRCIPCFTADCKAKGINVAWTTTEVWRDA